MPAINMAGDLTVPANPGTGKFVLMSPFSGPKGSPFDAKAYNPTTRVLEAAPTNFSTGGLNTGIGFGSQPIFNPTAPASIIAAGFADDYTPGVSIRLVAQSTLQTATTSILTAIGGGKSTIVDGTGANGNGTPASEKVSTPVPYNAQPLLGWGNGGNRDAGAGPAFTGFAIKTVTASVATVAEGAAIETGWLNRSGRTMVNTESAFGSATAASQAVA
jgi:hypothetical protein